MSRELGVQIVSGVLSREHVHVFVEIPPHIAVSDFVRRVKGRSSHRVQMEFPELRKRYWGRHFWARGYFCTTSGNITDEAILQYLGIMNLPASAGSYSVHDFSDIASFPKMISLRLGERMRQRLASLNTSGNGPLDGGQRTSGPVFGLNKVENFTILREAGDEPRHDAA